MLGKTEAELKKCVTYIKKTCTMESFLTKVMLLYLGFLSVKSGFTYFQKDLLQGVAWNSEKHCRPPWLADKKNFRILDALEWLKQKYFDLSDSLLIVSALKSFLFSLCLPFLFLLRKKVGGRGGWALPPRLPRCRRP